MDERHFRQSAAPPPESHPLDDLDAQQFETLLNGPGSEVAKQQPALAKRVALARST